jgi:opacity protein-like surface antigen
MQNFGASLESEAGRHPPRLFRMSRSFAGVAVAAALSFAVHASAQEASGQDASQAAPENRKAFFGEQHIHTSWSVDAWLFGNHTTGPDDALSYARGATIKHPLGYDITIDKPLDWMGVTDHSEYVGITKQANTPGSSVSKMPQAQPLILADPNDPADVEKVFNYLVSVNGGGKASHGAAQKSTTSEIE